MSADADVIGIDLGTTQSLVGAVDAGFPILLAEGRGSGMTRVVVYYAKDGTVGGEEAWRRWVTKGERTVTQSPERSAFFSSQRTHSHSSSGPAPDPSVSVFPSAF